MCVRLVCHMLFYSVCLIFTAGWSAGSNSLPLITGLICFHSAVLTARGSCYSTGAQGDCTCMNCTCVHARACMLSRPNWLLPSGCHLHQIVCISINSCEHNYMGVPYKGAIQREKLRDKNRLHDVRNKMLKIQSKTDNMLKYIFSLKNIWKDMNRNKWTKNRGKNVSNHYLIFCHLSLYFPFKIFSNVFVHIFPHLKLIKYLIYNSLYFLIHSTDELFHNS